MVNGSNFVARSSIFGDYYRPLLPGNYKVIVKAEGYMNAIDEIIVNNSSRLELNFTLIREDAKTWLHLNDFDIDINHYGTAYHDNGYIFKFLEDQSENYGNIAKFEKMSSIRSLKITEFVSSF